MAVFFATSNANSLLAKFNAAITQNQAPGKIETWATVVHNRTTYYTHTSTQWARQAFFRAETTNENLIFYIVNKEGSSVTTPVYGFYHGHLIETFLNHFDALFRNGAATARPVPGDVIQ